MDMEQKEFTVFGKSIEKLSLIYGMFLVFWGVAISFISGSTSATSYIPSYLGAPIVIFSVLSLYFPSRKKNFYAHSSFGRRDNSFRWLRFTKRLN